MKYRCIKCHEPFTVPGIGSGALQCKNCHYDYTYRKQYLRYEFDDLLYKAFRKQYLLNKVLNNNAYLSYHFLKESSISLAQREEVLHFKKFIQNHSQSGKLLDVGCGILELPGYLDFENKSNYEIYGMDPLETESFCGTKVVGCSEFMPFLDNTFDAVIFATSLDHVCSLERTISEAHRVLVDGGKALIWMSDNSMPFFLKLKSKLLHPWRIMKNGYDSNRYAVYPNHTVFYIPDQAVDPFHSFLETPPKIKKLFKKNFIELDTVYYSKIAVFLSFLKS